MLGIALVDNIMCLSDSKPTFAHHPHFLIPYPPPSSSPLLPCIHLPAYCNHLDASSSTTHQLYRFLPLSSHSPTRNNAKLSAAQPMPRIHIILHCAI